jgi:SAM-dependent methyltransferase
MDKNTQKEEDIRRAVRERYGAIATDGTVGCGCGCACGPEGGTEELVSIGQTIGYSPSELSKVPEGSNLGLGCGNPTALADLKDGETVLDLGSGAGFDCFLAAGRVGPSGRVIGVDMTPDMVERARRAAKAGGYENVEFRLGEIEALPVPDESVDAIISNCVLNLSPSRDRVLAEARRVLKPGGRIMISDLISDFPTPTFLLENTDALVGCLPVHREEYLSQLSAAGLSDVCVAEEGAYPTDLLTADPAVRTFLQENPGQTEAVEAFIGSIRSAMIQATKSLS